MLSHEVQAFLHKYPLITLIEDCEFVKNQKNGCMIYNHWKGPVIINKSKFIGNLENGLNLESPQFPISLVRNSALSALNLTATMTSTGLHIRQLKSSKASN